MACKNDRGFSFVDLLATTSLIMVVSAMTVPLMSTAINRSRLTGAVNDVVGQIRTARLKAVTTNRRMQVLLNCPAAGDYRVVEITGNPAVDADVNRCSYPWPDPDPNVVPNNDGPPMRLPTGVSFGTTQDLEIATNGRVTPLTGTAPARIEITDGQQLSLVLASVAGRIQTQ